MQATLSKKERLKSKKTIEFLFSEGKSVAQYPIRLIYTVGPDTEETNLRAAVSVSKRNCKKAVDRNHIKRLLRESYRKNKYLVQQQTTQSYNLMILYTGKEFPSSSRIEKSVMKVLQKFMDREISKSN